MSKHDNIARLFTLAKILIATLIVSIVVISCVPREELFIVPITDQDIRFLKKCLGEDSTVYIAMRDSHRKEINEMIKSNGSRTLASPYKQPFPPTIPEDRGELSSQCYHFIWYGSYTAEDPDFF